MTLDAPIDTIAALATAPGVGALSVIRMSGPRAVEVAGRVFRGRRRLEELSGFQGAFGMVQSGAEPVDEVVAWVYRRPRSYTGEDMVEISCHGGAVPSRRVLEVLWRAGARPAQPGEFTRRAFLNGRMDLSQGEAVAQLISARGRRAQEQALAQLQGGLSRRVRDLATEVRAVLAAMEAHLDFGEDVPEAPDATRTEGALAATQQELERLARSYEPSRRVWDGLVVGITGRPNVGKSSLLNALVGHDRAIVHESPGTTRDVVDAVVEWAGIPVRLLDTAGLRESGNPVEQAGIERTRRELSAADLVLWVVDGSLEPVAADREIARGLDWKRTHLVLNKADLGFQKARWAEEGTPRGTHRTSALTGEGIQDLVAALEAGIASDLVAELDGETAWVTSERHAHRLLEASEALRRARHVLTEGEPLELAAADLHRVLDALAAITGERASAELLDEIFRRFCVGK